MLAVVDFDMRFTYVLAGWEGSAHDGRVYEDAVARGFCSPAEGKYYLADAGYANRGMLLSPYRGVRYHLREIGAAGRRPRTKEELFNLRHSSLRNVVERTFGVFKRRWRIFDRPHEFSIKTQVKLVYGLVAIHNYISQHYPVTEDIDLPEEEEEEEGEVDYRESDEEMGARRGKIADELWQNYCQLQQSQQQALEVV